MILDGRRITVQDSPKPAKQPVAVIEFRHCDPVAPANAPGGKKFAFSATRAAGGEQEFFAAKDDGEIRGWVLAASMRALPGGGAAKQISFGDVVKEARQLMKEKKDRATADAGDEPEGFDTWDRSAVFGVKLSFLHYDSGGELPAVVEDTIAHLRTHCMGVEGVFRMSGRSEQINALRDAYNRGERPDLSESDPHVVSGVLKLWTSSLPEPLLTFRLYKRFLGCAKTPAELRSVLVQLPKPNMLVFCALLELWADIVANQPRTKMTSNNVGVSVGPSLLRERVETPESIMQAPVINGIVKDMVDRAEELLPELAAALASTTPVLQTMADDDDGGDAPTRAAHTVSSPAVRPGSGSLHASFVLPAGDRRSLSGSTGGAGAVPAARKVRLSSNLSSYEGADVLAALADAEPASPPPGNISNRVSMNLSASSRISSGLGSGSVVRDRSRSTDGSARSYAAEAGSGGSHESSPPRLAVPAVVQTVPSPSSSPPPSDGGSGGGGGSEKVARRRVFIKQR